LISFSDTKLSLEQYSALNCNYTSLLKNQNAPGKVDTTAINLISKTKHKMHTIAAPIYENINDST
jgi:hypothetical protein